jgi:hypothetical protein
LLLFTDCDVMGGRGMLVCIMLWALNPTTLIFERG